MALNLDYLRNLRFAPTEYVLSDRDAMLYALSVGLGRDPQNSRELEFVYEKNLKTFPTIALIIGQPAGWMSDQKTGITRAMVVHGAQRLTSYAEIPVGTPIISTNKITDILDKGKTGAMVVLQRESYNKVNGTLLARSESTIVCRADGGFGAQVGAGHEFKPIPDRCADMTLQVETMPNAALIYRLNHDRNPLHVDPGVARAAGFSRPILHGLCTLGMVAVEITRTFPDTTLRSIETRFSKPVLPGEAISIELWLLNNAVSFRASTRGGAVVLDRGSASLV
jgi:acyl dehydratase